MIKILCVGKIKEKYLVDGINEYLKRLSKYTKVSIIELPDFDYDINKTLKKEEENILKNIDEKDFVVTLEIEGKQLDSVTFSKEMDTFISNNKNIVFVIGGSYGLSDVIKKRSNYKLSFSKFTFPHQLFRLILLEQIYRSYKIINNETYHK